jgi:hypothetical protein
MATKNFHHLISDITHDGLSDTTQKILVMPMSSSARITRRWAHWSAWFATIMRV